jgi:hypothetical protein
MAERISGSQLDRSDMAGGTCEVEGVSERYVRSTSTTRRRIVQIVMNL